ncbi:MAG: pyruvate kinase [Planctomycetota bacterium]|nr:pyruvate kinase [Planctomycetota bacterium]
MTTATLIQTPPATAAVVARRETARGVERKTKIVCTVGPACQEADQIRQMLEAGTNVFRLNFSHADHDWATRTIETIREQAEFMRVPVAVMQDLCGPKIRLSKVAHENYRVEEGDTIRVTTQHHLDGCSRREEHFEYDVASSYSALVDDVCIGDTILVDDGRIAMTVLEKQDGLVVAQITRGGEVLPGKGLNLPGVSLSTESMLAKDWQDVQWGLKHEVDYIALSFVRHPSDLVMLQSRLEQAGSSARVIAKIERPEAIEHIEQIVHLADGLMVARGDLGLETDLANVPVLQKRLIELCREATKPVITATQVLDSMVNNSTPTRAEVSDVANAIFDGSDAVMLSNETAVGRHPIEAVDVIHRTALATEAELARRTIIQRRDSTIGSAVSAIAEAAANAAIGLGAQSIVVYSQTGFTARMMARYRLPVPVVAITNEQSTYQQLSLSFGVRPIYLPHIVDLPQLLEEMNQLALRQEWGESGDTLVVVSALDGQDGNIDTLHICQLIG